MRSSSAASHEKNLRRRVPTKGIVQAGFLSLISARTALTASGEMERMTDAVHDHLQSTNVLWMPGVASIFATRLGSIRLKHTQTLTSLHRHIAEEAFAHCRHDEEKSVAVRDAD
jgi:hypothetical protein